MTTLCPGLCGRTLKEGCTHCVTCWLRLPRKLRRRIKLADRKSTPAGRDQSRRAALEAARRYLHGVPPPAAGGPPLVTPPRHPQETEPA